mmetsp:Transcript_16878/g.14799  ORF Transcript_16878/g.14799 Transcript_16878/m.14799 type:complete len:82 (+) Transcript_16878:3-248(+)
MLTFEDFKNNYSHILNDKDIESFFTRFGKFNFHIKKEISDKIDLDEYLQIMLPQFSVMDAKVRVEAHDYLHKLLLQNQPFE